MHCITVSEFMNLPVYVQLKKCWTQLPFSKLFFKYLMYYSCRWSSWVSLSIQKQISEENLTSADAWDEIQNVCRKTVEDFKIILSTLDDFRTNELYVDQKKRKPTSFRLKLLIYFAAYIYVKDITPV